MKVPHSNQVRPVYSSHDGSLVIYSVASCTDAGHPLTTEKGPDWWLDGDHHSFECPCRRNIVEVFIIDSRMCASLLFGEGQ